jgi:hypothetical protein
MTITNKEKLQCAEREVSFRKRVYARLVDRGKMSEPQRIEELRLMEAIVDDYRALVAKEMPKLGLFVKTRSTINEER